MLRATLSESDYTMAASQWQTEQYTAADYVESVGAIVFNLAQRKVCLVHYAKRNEWLLAKGRRNLGQTRQQAAIREIAEETGHQCRILPLRMTTRNPPAVETEQHYPDEPRVHESACEPFMLTCRQLDESKGLKVIWWYVAAVDEGVEGEGGEEQFKAGWFSFEDAVERLTFELDRDVLREACRILTEDETARSV